MQVFIPYQSPLQVAKTLDKKRLNKQIIECDQILKAIKTKQGAWRNHPVVKMYRKNTLWLKLYDLCLTSIINNQYTSAYMFDFLANIVKPKFITQELCNQHRRRLYTKDKEYYKDFSKYGESDENWYVVDGSLVVYNGGKIIN